MGGCSGATDQARKGVLRPNTWPHRQNNSQPNKNIHFIYTLVLDGRLICRSGKKEAVQSGCKLACGYSLFAAGGYVGTLQTPNVCSPRFLSTKPTRRLHIFFHPHHSSKSSNQQICLVLPVVVAHASSFDCKAHTFKTETLCRSRLLLVSGVAVAIGRSWREIPVFIPRQAREGTFLACCLRSSTTLCCSRNNNQR